MANRNVDVLLVLGEPGWQHRDAGAGESLKHSSEGLALVFSVERHTLTPIVPAHEGIGGAALLIAEKSSFGGIVVAGTPVGDGVDHEKRIGQY